MLATELVGKTKQELKDLLLLNTQKYRFDDTIIGGSFTFIYDMFKETDNVLIEKQIFWEMVLQGLFGFDEDTINTLTTEIGAFEFINICEEHLAARKEVELFTSMYNTYYAKQESVGTLLRTVLNSFVDDLGNIQPEEINKIMSELNLNLNQLPDFIKNSVK